MGEVEQQQYRGTEGTRALPRLTQKENMEAADSLAVREPATNQRVAS